MIDLSNGKPLGGICAVDSNLSDLRASKMELLNFQQQSIAVLAALYLAAATAVWFAGSRADRYADEISQRTGIGSAVIGMVLLGSIDLLQPWIGVAEHDHGAGAIR